MTERRPCGHFDSPVTRSHVDGDVYECRVTRPDFSPCAGRYVMTDMTDQPYVCVRCLRAPAEITEYQVVAAREGMTPEDFVRDNEGTLNPANGHFACTGCYLAMGMPTTEKGWKAP